ncbi:hypothetical protein TSH100_26735 [Azospirillum sp. TSH100]|uniref:hypothetical protein n=1 Tax=Azospirillum sp. TSH100 TaxID=652764 RepID=UPI000D60947F|nr:hypothetical protein [Azospirillum sp. TSH100]PWC81640.1 hypothetical protein TSH100_26735 [Azospirillum sp. TSH100]QCG91282.1 hypothetical protein E6C72_26140 [Azospirillum sp. TSH100]
MATLKEFEDALKAAGNTAALEILESLRARDRSQRSVRPARRLTGRKMTPELAAEILHLHETTNMTQQEIAFQLGVNQGRVNEVIKRRKWLTDDPAAPEAQARDKAKQRASAGVGVPARRPTRRRKAKAEVDVEAGAAPEIAPGLPPEVVPPVEQPVEPEVIAAPEPPAESPAAEPPAPALPMAAPEMPVEQPSTAKDKPKAKGRKRDKAAEMPLFKDLL